MKATLERDQELREISTLLADAREHRGGIAVVEGPAGIGKSHLLGCVIDAAREQEMLVLRATGVEGERDFSFAVVLQLFERWLSGCDQLAREELFSGAAALARPLLQERQLDGAGVSAEGLLHGLFWVTVNISAQAPLLLAIDDLHWADAGSARFIQYLLPRLDELPVAVVLTRRAGYLDEPSQVTELAGNTKVQRVALAPLSPVAVGEVLKARLRASAGERFQLACHEATGGNPLLVEAVTRTLQDEGIEPTDGNAGLIASLRPELVQRQLALRVAQLGTEAAEFAQAAAVLGDEASLAQVAMLCGLDPDRAARAADALMGADILVSAMPVRFTHPLMRSGLYGQLAEAGRALMHARAAELLNADHAPVQLIAAQLLSATRVGEPWATRVLRDAAADATASGNVESAVRYLRRTLMEPLSGSVRAEILLELADAESRSGDAAAEAHVREALSLVVSAEDRADALQRLGTIHHARGDRAGAAEAYEQALELLAEAPDKALTRDLHAAYFTVASLDPELAPRAVAHLAPLLERQPGGETRGERAALAALAAHTASSGGPREQSIALAKRAWGDGAMLAEEGPDGFAWHLVTAGLGWSDAFDETVQVLDCVIAEARRQGSMMAYANATFTMATLSCFRGRVLDTRAYSEALEELSRYGWRAFAGTAAAVHARALIEHDELEAAERVLTVTDQLEESADRAAAIAARGYLHLTCDRLREACEDLMAAGAMLDRIGFVNPTPVPWRTDAAVAFHRAGDHQRAVQLADAALSLAERTGTPSHLGTALLTRAELTGQPEGIELLRRALEASEGSDSALLRVRCLAALGAAQRRAGQRAGARATLLQALDKAHRIGARRIERAVREELRIAGARPRRPNFSGPDSLTASERRVALMAAEGMSNRDIAGALFVTPRTVEQHLYNTYKKLGIQSRAEISAALLTPDASAPAVLEVAGRPRRA